LSKKGSTFRQTTRRKISQQGKQIICNHPSPPVKKKAMASVMAFNNRHKKSHGVESTRGSSTHQWNK
jgi:hypothetical protein